MKLLLTVVFLAVAFAVPAARAATANDAYVRDVWVPEDWEEPEVVNNPRGRSSYRPPTAAVSRGRAGATVGLETVTVHRDTIPGMKPVYTLQLDGERTVEVSEGSKVRLGKDLYTVLGEKDGVLRLQNRKTKEIRRFRRAADEKED